MFFNEIELLKVRLEEIHSVVDFFVICESPVTFRGEPKPLHFKESEALFEKYRHKIIHVVVDDLPETQNPWDREFAQRDALVRGCRMADDDDMIMISDADEIPRRETVIEVRNSDGFVAFDMPMYQYYMNLRAEASGWNRAFAVSWKDRHQLRNFTSGRVDKHLVREDFRDRYKEISRAGWHFTYLGGADTIRTKLKSFSHTEEWFQNMLNEQGIENQVVDGGVVGNYWHLAEYVPIDESFPEFVRRNAEYFRQIGYIKDIYEAHRELQVRARDLKEIAKRQISDTSKLLAASSMIGVRKFEKIVSVGTFCAAAAHLREAGLRDAAYPFDWLFSNPAFAADCIEDDFATFLDRQYLQKVEGQRKCRHEFYQERYPMGDGAIFNHHDPSSEPDYSHFQRTIERFRAVLTARGSTLFLMMIGADSLNEAMLKGIVRLHDALRAAPMLVMVATESHVEARGRLHVVWGRPGLAIARVFVRSRISDGMLFDDKEDTDQIISFLKLIVHRNNSSQ